MTLTKTQMIKIGIAISVLGWLQYNFEPHSVPSRADQIKEFATGEAVKCLHGKDLGYKFPTCEYYVDKYGKDISNYESIRAKLVSFLK